MKSLGIGIAASLALFLGSVHGAMTVVDFEEYAGRGSRIQFPQNFHGITFGPDFGTWPWPSHSGDVAAVSNRIAEGWKECFFTFSEPDQRFVGAWIFVFDKTLQFKMYKGDNLVATSSAVGNTSGWVFLPSNYDGGVDKVGVWGYRGVFGLDDITFTSIERPPAPRTAQAVAIVTDGKITGFTILDPGFGYRSVPEVAIFDATGSNAAGVVAIADQKVQSISVTHGGNNYSSTPFVRIGLPDFVAGLKVKFSKVMVVMTLDIGKRYQLYSSQNLFSWTMVGEPFLAESDSKSVEFEIGADKVFYQLRRLE